MAGQKPVIKVRAPRPGDLAEVVAMETRSFQDPWAQEALEQELAPDRLRLPLVAEISGKVVGYLMAWKIIDQLHILNIATDPDYRRLGVGTAMLGTAAEKAGNMGMVQITLEVRESNQEAYAFYRKHGYVARGRRKSYYADNGEDAIIMTRRIAGFRES